MPVTSIFSFSNHVFYPGKELICICIPFKLIVYRRIWFGRVLNLSFATEFGEFPVGVETPLPVVRPLYLCSDHRQCHASITIHLFVRVRLVSLFLLHPLPDDNRCGLVQIQSFCRRHLNYGSNGRIFLWNG